MILREDNTINDFCSRLSSIHKVKIEICSKPDKENEGKGGCDAIIKINGVEHALEHTTVDSYELQRKDTADFMRVVNPLVAYIEKNINDSWVEICIPSRAIPKGCDWEKLTESLKSSSKEAINRMPIDDTFRKFDFPGVPFSVEIARHQSHGKPGCYVMREAPADRHKELETNIERALKKKATQVLPYKKKGMPTILLLDSNDPTLMNKDNFAKAFGQASIKASLESFDNIYFCETDRSPAWIYPLKLGNKIYPKLTEFDSFFHIQYEKTYPNTKDVF